MHVLYVSDAKAGHRSQALGLYQAIHRIRPESHLEEIHIQQLPILSLIKSIFTHRCVWIKQEPDWIIGVGSHTHLRVWLLGKIYPRAKTVILMKPSLPVAWFDYAVVPEHDGMAASDHVIVTQGAISPVVNQYRHETNRILIALGGDSKRHQWNDQKVLKAIEQIIQQNPEATIILTTSRRTPLDFLTQLKAMPWQKKLQFFPIEETPQGWIFEQMQLAEAVWVTEDSVSMLFEALSAGCKVGLICIDRLKSDRITSAIDQLLTEQLVVQATAISELPKQTTFKEADRVATYLLRSR